MSKLLKSLLATTAFLALAPTTASALSQCWQICSNPAYCDKQCIVGNRILTCRTAGFCSSADEAPDETASVTTEETEPALVCSETQQATESSASINT